MRNLFILTFFAFTWLACSGFLRQGPLASDFNHKLYFEVMALHDTIMIKTNREIMLEQQRLKKQLAQVEDSTAKRDLLQTLSLLKRAEDEMMEWMAQFKGLELDEAFYWNKTKEEIKTYLSEQYTSIEQVGILTDSAIIQAAKFKN